MPEGLRAFVLPRSGLAFLLHPGVRRPGRKVGHEPCRGTEKAERESFGPKKIIWVLELVARPWLSRCHEISKLAANRLILLVPTAGLEPARGFRPYGF